MSLDISTPEQGFTTIDLMRHGQVVHPEYFCAPEDEPLSFTGWREMANAAQDTKWDQIVSSNSARCRCFASSFSRKSTQQLEINKEWREMEFGSWVGVDKQHIWDNEAPLLHQLWFNPKSFTAPDGESMQGFIERIQAAWDELLETHAGKNILLVTHAGAIRVTLATALGISYQETLQFEIAHAHFTRLRVYPDGGVSLLGLGLPQIKQ